VFCAFIYLLLCLGLIVKTVIDSEGDLNIIFDDDLIFCVLFYIMLIMMNFSMSLAFRNVSRRIEQQIKFNLARRLRIIDPSDPLEKPNYLPIKPRTASSLATSPMTSPEYDIVNCAYPNPRESKFYAKIVDRQISTASRHNDKSGNSNGLEPHYLPMNRKKNSTVDNPVIPFEEFHILPMTNDEQTYSNMTNHDESEQDVYEDISLGNEYSRVNPFT
jgi:hypothetical protein